MKGLLGLTNFKTPNLHDEFYQREALGVATWDLFDEVAGAYGGELDRLLALGGSDAAKPTNPDEGKSRFPPVVKFLGPFSLEGRRETRAHRRRCREYVGAVRVMVVAGDGSAYGSAEKSVFVRQALMILPTLPRVIGPDEAIPPAGVGVHGRGVHQGREAGSADRRALHAGGRRRRRRSPSRVRKRSSASWR